VELTATVTNADLEALVAEAMPMRVEISARPQRRVEIAQPSLVELVPGQGLRLRGEARLTWELPFPVTLRTWQALLVPSIETRDGMQVLAFEPVLEALDLQSLPGFLDERIAGAINEALEAYRHKLAWAFGKTLAVKLQLPTRISPSGRFELSANRGDVEVTADALRLTIGFAAHVLRGPAIVTTHFPEQEVAAASGARSGPGSRRMPRPSPPSRRGSA
jgi:hypothetical protein